MFLSTIFSLIKQYSPFISLFLCCDGELCPFRADIGLAFGTRFLLELGEAGGCRLP